MTLRMTLLEGRQAVCRLPATAALPPWAGAAFSSVTRTADELSVVCADEHVPPTVRAERGWRLLRVEGPLPFDAVGIAAAIASPLAAAEIPILLIGTFDTDYLLVSESKLTAAVAALHAAGIEVSTAHLPSLNPSVNESR